MHISHGHYTDQSGIGRVYFTPVGIGPRFWATTSRARPFVEAIPCVVFSEFAQNPGFEAGAGIAYALTGRAGLEGAASYIRSGGWTLKAFDAPNTQVEGLDDFFVRVEATLRVGRLAD